MLFDLLTVKEHLWLFGQFKVGDIRFVVPLQQGLSGSDLLKETTRFPAMLGLADKADYPVAFLSGGQKRAISVALALVGSPSTVILDEPTSGMSLITIADGRHGHLQAAADVGPAAAGAC